MKLGQAEGAPTTMIFISYWLSSNSYNAWWKSHATSEFWSNLTDDAGVWREVMTVSAGRFMHGAHRPSIKTGFARVTELQSLSLEEAPKQKRYWGIYRARMSDSERDKFESPFVCSSTPPESLDGTKPVLPLEDPTPEKKEMCRGRVHLPEGIDNLVWVREYEDYSRLEAAEREQWDERIGAHINPWIEYLNKERVQNGILSFSNGTILPDLPLNACSISATGSEKFSQLGYFLDLAHFEQSGRADGRHRKPRLETEKLYGSSGQFGGENAQVQLLVEVAVLKRGDMEAEYVGCTDGTGLMKLERFLKIWKKIE